jgi:CHAD domain-containing protein
MAKAAPIHRMTDPDAPLRESSPVLMVRLNELFEWAESVRDPACVEELHNMRIAAKRLRYTLELFAPVLGPEAGPLLKTAEEIQEHLGQIHDCDMLFPLIGQTLEEEMARERKKAVRSVLGPPKFIAAEGLVPLLSRKRAEREEKYRAFLAYWDALPPEGLFDRLNALVRRPLLVAGRPFDA